MQFETVHNNNKIKYSNLLRDLDFKLLVHSYIIILN